MNEIFGIKKEEFIESVRTYAKKMQAEKQILESQLKRFNERFGSKKEFISIVEKIKSKYESEAYRNKEYEMGYEPREYLFYFLNKYAIKYGREATKKEYKTYSNMFTSSIFYIHGYYFMVMDGQGSIIQIFTKEDYGKNN
jgi:hypothetical protein